MVVQENTGDRELVTALVEQWVTAIRAGDLEGVVAGHADDIVMFDVPPPQDGIRGLVAYRKCWPPFLRWLAGGAVFELVRLEVTAGADVAFAHALLRCGTPEHLARHADHRLRITLGLRKEADRWVIAHEHHSFPLVEADDPQGQPDDPQGRVGEAVVEQQIRTLHDRWFEATAAKDLDALMAVVDDDVVSYEHVAPLEHVGVARVRQVCRQGLEAGVGEVDWRVPQMSVVTGDDLAVAWGLNRVRAQGPDGRWTETWSRGTRVFRRGGDGWSMVHQHLSYPVDPRTGAARTDLTP